jgi:hypothetical protein
MADNTTLNAMAGGDVIASDDLSGVKYQRVKATWGVDGVATDVNAGTPLPVSAVGQTITGSSTAIVVATPANTAALDVSKAGNATFIVKNTAAASAWAGAPVLVFEQSDDSTSWAPLGVTRSDTSISASTFTLGVGAANAELMFDAALEGVNWVRVRCTTAPATNGLTIVIQPGGMPFSPSVTAFIQGPSSVTSGGPTSVTAATTDTLLLAANPLRKGVTIFNDSTSTLKVSLGTNAASATAFTVLMAAAGYLEVPFGYVGMIRGIWLAANGFARVTELVI